MPTISKAAVVILVNSSEIDICLPLKIKTTEQVKKKETQPETDQKPLAPPPSPQNKLLNRISKIQNIKTTPAPTEYLVVAAKSAVQIDNKILDLYDYEPFIENSQLMIVDKIKEEKPKEEEPVDSCILINNTARKIGIRNKFKEDSEFIIPAFGNRRIDEFVLNQHDYGPWKDLNLIEVKKDQQQLEEMQKEKWMALIVWMAYGWIFILVLQWMGLDKHFGGPDSLFSFSIWVIWPAIAVLITVIYLIREYKGIPNFARYMFKFVNMLGFYVWPLLVPVAVVLFFGGVLDIFMDMLYGGTGSTAAGGYFSAGLLLRLLQLVFIVILSSIPGMLYFQYERRQVGTLRAQFIRNIMFLNPLIHTTDDAEIEYGKLVDEVTVSSGANFNQFSILRTGWPILLSTVLITLCWIFTLWPVGEIPVVNSIEVINLLSPQMSLISFAFLGAYFFALNLLFKRYSRGDLSPKAYSHISIRIISAIILVWVIGVVINDSSMEITKASFIVLAFGIGLIPETGITFLKTLMENKRVAKIFPGFKVKHPITELEGISLYDQARLTEEGVENVETLAHHNMIEIMLRSGIPVARLVDLMDQAILYLHTTGIVTESATDEKDKPPRRGIDILRNEGIRTATDLLAVEKLISDGSNDTDSELKKRRNPETFYTLLDPEGKTTYRMQRVLDALKDDEWLVYIQNWRNIGLCQDTLVTNPYEIIKEERRRA